MNEEILGRLNEAMENLLELEQMVASPVHEEIKSILMEIKNDVEKLEDPEVARREVEKIEKVLATHRELVEAGIKEVFDSSYRLANDHIGITDIHYEKAMSHIKKGSVVYDIGCGRGRHLKEMAKKVGPYGEVIGIDISPAAVKEARKNTVGSDNVFVLEGDASELLGKENRPVDAILAIRVLEYLTDTACSKLLDEMVHVTKQGGDMFIAVEARDFYDLFKRGDVDKNGRTTFVKEENTRILMKLFNYFELERMLKARGLNDYSIHPISAWEFSMQNKPKLIRYLTLPIKYLAAEIPLDYFVSVRKF